MSKKSQRKVGAVNMLKSILILFAGLILLRCGQNMPEDVQLAYKSLPEQLDFNFHVRPILSDRCFHCHGFDEKGRKADLRLDVREAAILPTAESGTIPIVPGKPWESTLIKRILSHDEEMVMPPAESKLHLSAEEKATLIKWIEQGAEWKEHWAYILPEKSVLPTVKNESFIRNEIDHFVLEKLNEVGLDPSVEASKETLIRRVSFDLTGLPPTLDEIDEFKNDNSKDAYEKVVDRLLASPKFGERWCWEWLDVARYADTNGYQGDPTRTMWPWRDWVIQAFNDNMPYDEFTVKQLAGDLLPDPKPFDYLATGFSRNNAHNGEGGRIPEETRVENVFDRVETMGTAWLGLTLNCSRCHDHKFDAITQKEYYQFFDFFNQTSETGRGGNGRIPPTMDFSPQKDQDEAEELKRFLHKVAKKVEDFEWEKFPRESGPPSKSPGIAIISESNFNALDREPKDRQPYQLNVLQEYFNKDYKYIDLLDELKAAKSAHNRKLDQNIFVMVMDQLDTIRPTYVLARGTYNKHLEQVRSDVPKALPPLPEGVEKDRLALARWLVADENPLMARVTVNRYWQAFFGRGLVKTIEDFGVQGALPTHPELLDWLAKDFQENGWNLKALFKKIVMSGTYRQSSRIDKQRLELDIENKYLSRASRTRLPSWMLRDQALHTSGLLVDSLGGPPVKPYQPEGIWEEATFGKIKYQQDHGEDLYRRTLYTFWRRISGPTMLFDNSARNVCVVKSMYTNTPLHALTTLNDITYVEAARVMAERVLLKSNTDQERIAYAFRLATGRLPEKSEEQILSDRLKVLKEDFNSNAKEANKLTGIGEYPINENLSSVEHAAYTAICSVILNLDETITKQ